jgi:TonB-linked SusC/RagA family outer membrane protein
MKFHKIKFSTFSKRKVLKNCLALFIMLLFSATLSAQSRTVSGIVKDTKGEPLIGVAVQIKGNTTTGTVTDINGNFSINASVNTTLVFSYIGYATLFVPATQIRLNIEMTEETKKLDEVVVVGYGKQSRAKVTGAISEVSAKDLDGREVRTASQALQGKAPGLVISSTSGQPGSEGISMNIRGKNSWGTSSDPLVLIDGVPGDMDVISPDVIESITVLKDAASAAIYGSRAANGVILVTTKRGTMNKIQVSYSTVFSTQSPTMKYQSIQDPVEFMNLYNTALKNTTGTTSDFYTADDISKFQNGTYQGTNWNNYLYQHNVVQEHRLNLSGGTENVKYSTGISYLNQPGVIRNFGYNRYTFSGNFDLKVNKYITSGGSMGFTRGNFHEPSWGIQNIMILSLVSKPTYNPTYIDPVTGQTKIMRARWAKENVNASLEDQLDNLGQHTTMSDALNLQAFVNITPLEGLVWQTKAATYYTHQYNKKYKIATSDEWYQVENTRGATYDPSSISLSIDQPWEQLNTIYSTLSYTKILDNVHNFNVMGGYELDYDISQSMSSYRQGFPTSGIEELNAGNASTATNGGSSSEWAIQSYFGRLNYDYAAKYLVEGVIRNDQSSRFKKGFKAAVFPSVSLGWVVSKEQFMKSLPIISDLKVRASWGKLGNQAIGNYPYQATYTAGTSSSYNFNGLTPGAVVSGMVNENLSWETTTVKNVGIDLNIKDGLFSLTAEYYNKLTTDILRGAQVTATTGLSAPTINNGSMRNSGFEFVLGHKKKINDKLSYWVNANISFNRNRVVSFGSTEIDGNNIIQEGKEYGAWYMYKMVGIYQQNDPDIQKLKVDGVTQHAGQIKYQDVDGDGNITSADRQIVGHKYPAVTFGITLGAQYGNFDFSAFIYGVQGYDGYQSYFGFEPFLQGGSPNIYWRNAWTPQNQSNRWPQIYFADASGGDWYRNHPSTFYLQDLSFTRLKNIQVGYTLPASMLKATPFTSLRVYVSGENLLSVYNNKYAMVDPETQQDGSYYNVRYPQLKTFSMGLTLKF